VVDTGFIHPRASPWCSVFDLIDLAQIDSGVNITVKAKGLSPNSTHGFHIHESGDCSSEDAKSAGGHFSPAEKPHGAPGSENSHMGDLGNLVANLDGEVDKGIFIEGATLNESGAGSILGRAFVMHAGADDFKSQPSGNSGKRIACAVIK